jgi:hypothetical protein
VTVSDIADAAGSDAAGSDAAGSESAGPDAAPASGPGANGPGPAAGSGGEGTLRDVADLAAQHGLGTAQAVHPLGGGDVGCLGFIVTVSLLAPGIGMVIGPFPGLVTWIGVALLVIAVATPFASIRYERRRDLRIPRLHLFDGGVIITYPGWTAVHPWSEIRTVESSRSVTYGQNLNTATVHRLELHIREGEFLCSLGEPQASLVRRLAAEAE